MKFFYKLASLSLLSGVIHTVLTPRFFREMNDDWFWFSATGLTLIFSGLLNLFAIYGDRKWMFNICILSNIIMTIWTILLINYTENKAYFVLVMYLAVLAGSLYFRFTSYNRLKAFI